MSLMLELPSPIDEELIHEAQREGVSEADHAALFICLATTLLRGEKTTPFQDAVNLFFANRELDARRVAAVLDELVTVCLKSPTGEGKTSASLYAAINHLVQQQSQLPEEQSFVLLQTWRNAFVHRGVVTEAMDVDVNTALSTIVPVDTTLQTPGRLNREDSVDKADSDKQGRDPELAARVKAVRGKYAHTTSVSGIEELHRERQSDKVKEEAQIRGYQS